MASESDKPELSLLPGELAFDLDALVAFFEKVIGRKATPEEIEEARQALEDARPQIEAALRDDAEH